MEQPVYGGDMFVKVTKSGPRRYVKLVESYRDEAGKPRQRVIASIFLTPASGGASPHLDMHENFTVQLTGARGAPLGLEVLILQKLLATGLGGTILLLVCVAVTAAS